MARKPNIIEVFFRKIEIFCESVRGLDFSKVMPSEDLGFDPNLVSKCSPSGSNYLKNVFHDLKIASTDNILDIGCGKGSAIYQMTKFPFNKTDGIEISQIIAARAKLNFKKLKFKKVKIYNVSAESFDSYGDYNFFYMYNPFPQSVMEKVIERIISQNNSYSDIYVIYNNPRCSDFILQSGFNLIKVYPDQWDNGIHLYKRSK
jgi:SAM-dependent methyltransferase